MSVKSSILSLARKVETKAPTFTKTSCPFSTSAVAKQVSPSRSSNMSTMKQEMGERANLPPSLQQAIKEEAMPKGTAFSLEPYIGRSITHPNANVAYRQLNGILSRNKIRMDVRNNRYYVKPNEARRQQKLESQRKLFNAMVKKKIGIIVQMKQRGM